jgi:lantibiotic modifying enzyme
MRPTSENDKAASEENRRMLVLGYQGTLQLDPDVNPATHASYGGMMNSSNACEEWSAHIARSLEPYVKNAVVELQRRIPSDQRSFGAQRLPLDSLLNLLRERLIGLLTQAIAAEPDIIDFPRKLPTLFALLQQSISEWIAAMAAFHVRLQRDGPRLARWLGLDVLPPVESISGTSSDTHTGGHRMLRIRFTNALCVYYKPRPVTGEWLWHGLLEAVAIADPTLRLPSGRVLAGGNPARYGWAASLDNAHSSMRPSASPAAAQQYWHAAGAMLCLAYQVNLTDLHLGNILSTPDGPAVLDAECFGTPELFPLPRTAKLRTHNKFHTAVESLLGTGLLPRTPLPTMPDLSGLFGSGGPAPGIGLPYWSSSPGEKCRLHSGSAVLLHDAAGFGKSSALTVLPQLLAGFRQAASALIACRQNLIASGAHWRSVLESHHAPRIVLRDTLTYGLWLSQSLELKHLHSAHHRRSALLDLLRSSAPAPLPNAVHRSELEALLLLHVPRLIALPGTRTLASGSGRALQHNFASCTSAEVVLRRMEKLSLQDLEDIHLPALLSAILHKGHPSSQGH